MKSSLRRNVFLLILGASGLYLLGMAGLAQHEMLPATGWIRKTLYVLGPLFALFAIPRFLVGMFQHTYHVRYRLGYGRQALKEWKIWRFLLPFDQYEQIRFTLLLEVDDFAAAEKILGNPALPAWKVEHMRHAVSIARGQSDEAQQHLRRALEMAPPYELANCKIDLAIFLAQHDSDKIVEAFRLLDEALRESVQPALKPLVVAQESLLFVVAGQPALAQDIIQKRLPIVERLGLNALPSQGYLNRWLAWAECVQGKPVEALARLKKFRDLVKVPVYQKKFDEDIRRIEAGEPLFQAVPEEALVFAAERARRPNAGLPPPQRFAERGRAYRGVSTSLSPWWGPLALRLVKNHADSGSFQER